MRRIFSIILLILAVSINAYPQVRDTVPYAGLSVGLDLRGIKMYTGFNFGVRIRSVSNSRNGASCWLGTETALLGTSVCVLSFKFGRSF